MTCKRDSQMWSCYGFLACPGRWLTCWMSGLGWLQLLVPVALSCRVKSIHANTMDLVRATPDVLQACGIVSTGSAPCISQGQTAGSAYSPASSLHKLRMQIWLSLGAPAVPVSNSICVEMWKRQPGHVLAASSRARCNASVLRQVSSSLHVASE